ncbi:ornithine cyclodeaminase family protein [Nocardioides sp. CBS4Y-1]|uniref:Ornithine cyclodeaminase family protein n=2 Tax=Nocardioides acrostichi TaxID=2784339 RepID=A0A930YBR4_9ACTN|nr:ornithine cyclodeaminase family protein [Nocardioides acrostichi]
MATDWSSAVDALEQALCDGLDPELDPIRSRVEAVSGELLLMPSASPAWVGTKLVTVCPRNPDRGEPLVQAVYVLFDGDTLRPVATMDGTALTVLRTAAVSTLAARCLAPASSTRLVVFGSGVQARGHIAALRDSFALRDVTIVDPAAERASALARDLDAKVATPDEAEMLVAEADIIVCATNAGVPLFDGEAVRKGSLTIAMGSYTPTTREVDSSLVARSLVAVESRHSALAEAGDVIIPMAEGVLEEDDLVTLATLVTEAPTIDPDVPRLFTATGMSWQDLVVAAAIHSNSGTSIDGANTHH